MKEGCDNCLHKKWEPRRQREAVRTGYILETLRRQEKLGADDLCDQDP